MKTILSLLCCSCLLILPSLSQAQSKKALKLYNKGKAAMEERKYIQATVDFTNAIARDRDFADAYFQRGLSFAAVNRLDAAIQDYESAIQYDDQQVMVYLNLILVHKIKKDFPSAVKAADLFGERMPALIGVAQYHKAVAYETAGETEKALQVFEEAIPNLDPQKNKDFEELLKICLEKLDAAKKK